MAKKKTDGTADPLETFATALEEYHSGRIAEADRLLAEVESAVPPSDPLAERARTFREICRKRQEARQNSPEPTSWEELYDRGVFLLNEGAWEEALRAFDEALALEPGAAPCVDYAVATLHARRKETAAALDRLRNAFTQAPEFRYMALHDPDFAALREVSEFKNLLENPQ
ncbi:MAG: hypothetical protein Kow00109_06690 [Acidobacteriota bacterium]